MSRNKGGRWRAGVPDMQRGRSSVHSIYQNGWRMSRPRFGPILCRRRGKPAMANLASPAMPMFTKHCYFANTGIVSLEFSSGTVRQDKIIRPVPFSSSLQFDRRCQRFEVSGNQRTGKARKSPASCNRPWNGKRGQNYFPSFNSSSESENSSDPFFRSDHDAGPRTRNAG